MQLLVIKESFDPVLKPGVMTNWL